MLVVSRSQKSKGAFPGGSAVKNLPATQETRFESLGLGDTLGGGSEVAQSCPTLPVTPPSMGFSRQEYWSGLPFPSPGHLPYPGIEPRSPALQAVSFTN